MFGEMTGNMENTHFLYPNKLKTHTFEIHLFSGMTNSVLLSCFLQQQITNILQVTQVAINVIQNLIEEINK